MDRIHNLPREITTAKSSGFREQSEQSPTQSMDRIELSPDKDRKVTDDENLLKSTIARLPKVDIHRHLEGAIKTENILRVANKYGVELPANTLEGLKPYVCVTDKDETLTDFLKKFKIIDMIFVNTNAVKEVSKQCVIDAHSENVKAMELRFSPQAMAAAGDLSLNQVMDAVIEGVREGEKETGMIVGLTTVVSRRRGIEMAQQIEDLTEEYLKRDLISNVEGELGTADILSKGFNRVTSIDLASDEANFPAGPYAPVFNEAEREGIHRTIHAGEARGAESVRTAIDECHAERIGHGIRSFEDPALVRTLVEKGIPLEMCPTSNVQTDAIDNIKNHPLKKFYDMGGKATINTDDPGVCDIDLNTEYMRAIKDIGCSLEDVENMVLYAVDALFLPPPIKMALRTSIAAEIQKVNREL
ncbi:MAG: adenosine deaminase [Vulcanimicrobiota bacterium]